MSRGVENRPSGTVALNAARFSGVSSPMNMASNGVSPATGASAQTRILSGAFRGFVDGQARARAKRRGRADVDEDAAAMRAHMRDEGLRGEQDRLDVDGEDAIEL